MNQSKTTQTKKNAPKSTRQSPASKKAGKTTRTAPKTPGAALEPQDAAPNALQDEAPIEQESSGLATNDAIDSSVESADYDLDVLASKVETDEQIKTGEQIEAALDMTGGSAEEEVAPVEISLEGEVAGLLSTAQFTQVIEPLAELSMDDEGTGSDVPAFNAEEATIREITDVVDESLEEIPDISTTGEQSTPSSGDAATDLGTSDPVRRDAIEQDDTKAQVLPAKRVKGVERHLRSVNQRYATACNEVSRLRSEFIFLLNAKSAHLGIPRSGEAVPMRSTEMDTLNAEIREARQKLDALLERKRQIKGADPDLQAVNTRIREISRQRQVARSEKKAAYQEAMEAQSLVETDSLATP